MGAMNTHLCAAVDCTERIRRGLLMCPKHWRMVPKGLRLEIVEHLRLFQSALRAAKRSHRALRAAVKAAKDAVLTAELNPDLTLNK
jgi:hypothetical protein